MDIVEQLRTAPTRLTNVGANAEKTMTAAADEIERLREALRKVAIVSYHRMTYGGGTVPSGLSCEICEAECDHGQPLIHVGDCPLTVLNPSQ